MAKGYVAATQLPLGVPGKEDPDRPGFELVAVLEPGEKVDAKRHGLDADALEGLLANGYIKEA